MLERNFDHKENTLYFFGICFFSVAIGLSLGGLVDALVRKNQNDDENYKNRDFSRSFLFFVLQASLNIIILILLTNSSKFFVPWLQLSVSGALFAVLLFTSQRNLVDNVLRITNF
jgi:hypothetical protein